MDKCESKYCGCLYYSSNALARLMTKMADEEFAPLGITSSYAILINSINEKPGIHPKEISQQMQLSPSTVTRLIEKMETRGLVERKSHGRITEVYPTKDGIDLQQKLKLCWTNLHERYTAILGKEESTHLTENIKQAIQTLI